MIKHYYKGGKQFTFVKNPCVENPTNALHIERSKVKFSFRCEAYNVAKYCGTTQGCFFSKFSSKNIFSEIIITYPNFSPNSELRLGGVKSYKTFFNVV